jgi:soluble lytic murein transglycosylase-like protein
MLLAAVYALPANAQIYSGISPGTGAIVLSNFPSDETPVTLVPAAAGSTAARPAENAPVATATGPATATAAKPSVELRNTIESVAKRVQVPSDLLYAVISVESNYDVKARSTRGAMGLMQLMPETARRFGATDPYDAQQNILAGASYLKWLMILFGGDVSLALAAYNAGEQAVLRAGRRIPPFPETQAYVPRVLASRQIGAWAQP